MKRFAERLREAWARNDSLLCVGLDPEPGRFPQGLRGHATPILEFNRQVVDATLDLVCAYKPQFAHYAACGAEEELARTIDYIHRVAPHVPVILDAKRGDIGSTAEHYAREAFDRYGADAVTANPYLGGDTLEPFLARADKGVFVLCRTSNPGAGDLQDLDCGGRKLHQVVAGLAATRWNTNGNCMLVVGATYPQELAAVRAIVGDMALLVPGVGAQGGDVEAAVRAGRTADGTGLVVNASRGVLYAAGDFPGAVREAARVLRAQINAARRRA